MLIDKIYKIEEFKEFCKDWSVGYKHVNTSPRPEHPVDEYTQEIEEILRKKFPREFEYYESCVSNNGSSRTRNC